jgi:hypothetical protein
MTSNAAARIQSATALKNGGKVASNSFAARAQATAAHNEAAVAQSNSSASTSGSKD